MKSLVLGAGAGISAALMVALSNAGINRIGVTRPAPRVRSRSGVSRMTWPATVTSSQKIRNPADPAQAYLIARAEAKRARRAKQTLRNANRAWLCNDAHDSRNAFNPEFIAK